MRVGPRKIVNGRKLLVYDNDLFIEGRFKNLADSYVMLNHLRYKSGVKNLDPIGCFAIEYISLFAVFFWFLCVISITLVNTVITKTYDWNFILTIIVAPILIIFPIWYIRFMLKQLKPLLEYSGKTLQYKSIIIGATKAREITIGKVKSVKEGYLPHL